MSSIQLLETVQLGIDGAAGSMASQAALEVCERTAERVAALQRTASAGRPGSAGSRSISRVGCTLQRQASRAAAGRSDAIQE